MAIGNVVINLEKKGIDLGPSSIVKQSVPFRWHKDSNEIIKRCVCLDARQKALGKDPLKHK
jgi:hypothetical protein